MNENGIEGSIGGIAGASYFENVFVPGDRVRAGGNNTTFKNFTVTRADWLNFPMR